MNALELGMANIRTGIDIVECERFKAAFEKHLSRYASEYEKAYVREDKVHPWIRLSGLFAAKESVIKAIRMDGIALNEVCIEHEALGAPKVVLSDRLQKLLEEEGMQSIDISISHDGQYAIATCCLLLA